jgi:hypothetical protein
VGSVAAGGVEHRRAHLGASVAFDGGGNRGVIVAVAAAAVVVAVAVAVAVAARGILVNE